MTEQFRSRKTKRVKGKSQFKSQNDHGNNFSFEGPLRLQQLPQTSFENIIKLSYYRVVNGNWRLRVRKKMCNSTKHKLKKLSQELQIKTVLKYKMKINKSFFLHLFPSFKMQYEKNNTVLLPLLHEYAH